MRVCITFLMLVLIVACSSQVKIIKNQNKFYEKSLNLKVLDKAEISLPFVPAKIQLFSTEIFKVNMEKNLLQIKAVAIGNGKISLLDEDDIRLGIINIFFY